MFSGHHSIDLPGLSGRRISIESASKMWNACGLRIGSLVTDNEIFHEKVVSESTANLCANAIGQYIFSSILDLSKNDLLKWYRQQRDYYSSLMNNLKEKLKYTIPGIIVSNPESAIYLVLDFKNITNDNFEITKFIEYCATSGECLIDGVNYTLLLAPMTGFYSDRNLGQTQARILSSENQPKHIPHPACSRGPCPPARNWCRAWCTMRGVGGGGVGVWEKPQLV